MTSRLQEPGRERASIITSGLAFFCALLCSLLLCRISLSASADDDLSILKSLKDRVPELDASEAIRAGRTRFLGIAGYATSVPGVDRKTCIVDRALVDLIPGTGDVWLTQEHRQLQDLALEYAERYNAVIKREFGDRELPMSCIPK